MVAGDVCLSARGVCLSVSQQHPRYFIRDGHGLHLREEVPELDFRVFRGDVRDLDLESPAARLKPRRRAHRLKAKRILAQKAPRSLISFMLVCFQAGWF